MTTILPKWLDTHYNVTLPTDAARMRYVITLSQLNVMNRTGGPFGAAIFNADGELIGHGVNLVVPQNCSIWHAEMTAIYIAQRNLKHYSLDNCTLYTSCEPCVMCYGGIHWSRLAAVVYGATKTHAEAIGFDEGHKPSDWAAALGSIGCAVSGPLLADEANEVLQLYNQLNFVVY